MLETFEYQRDFNFQMFKRFEYSRVLDVQAILLFKRLKYSKSLNVQKIKMSKKFKCSADLDIKDI